MTEEGAPNEELKPAEDSLRHAEELLGRLEQTRARLEATDDPEAAIEEARRQSDA